MVFFNTVTLVLTNKHDTVVGSSPRASHNTLTDGGWDDIKHPAPNPPAPYLRLFLFIGYSSAYLILYCSSTIFFPTVSSFMPLWISIPLSFSHSVFCHPTTPSVFPFLLFFLFPPTCPFALYFTPSANIELLLEAMVWQESGRSIVHIICGLELRVHTALIDKGEAQLWTDSQIIAFLHCSFLQAVWNSPRHPVDRPYHRQHVTSTDITQDAKTQAYGF